MTVDTDFVDIAFVAGGIEITLSGNAANTLRSIFHGLAGAKPDRELRDRMFPETGVAGFRDRHEEGMRREVSGAVERVLAGFPAGNRVVLNGGGAGRLVGGQRVLAVLPTRSVGNGRATGSRIVGARCPATKI